MEGQREHILRKGLECMLEKGLAETSIRDICTHAGVSIGAFYTHFADRQEAVFAACALDVMDRPRDAAATTWAAYEAKFLEVIVEEKKPRARKRLRLSYQFVGELAVYDKVLPGFEEAMDYYDYWFKESLQAMAAAGEITLPLGLELTARLHTKLWYGTLHMLVVDKSLDRRVLISELLIGLGMIAGRK
jgi:AcrR family transcriptional regulator